MTKTQAIALAAAVALSPLTLVPAAMDHHGAVAYASPVSTINLTDIPDVDTLPVCVQEDCSDQPGQVGMWLDRDTGNWYLERGEDYTRRVIDNTVTVAHGVAAANGGVPGTGLAADAIDAAAYCGYDIDLSVRTDIDCD